MTTGDHCGASLDAMVLKRKDGQTALEKRCPNGHTQTVSGFSTRVSYEELQQVACFLRR